MCKSLIAALLMLVLVFGAQAGETCSRPATLTQEHVSISGPSGTSRFAVEIADSSAARAAGLMCRTSLAEDNGMLLIYPRPQIARIWMKDTFIPLDILFVAMDGHIVKIATDAIPESLRRIEPDVPVTSVLELPAGTAARYGIQVGDRLHRENRKAARVKSTYP